MKEKPGIETPWIGVNQLLSPDERFEVVLPHWQGFLLAPKSSSKLAALFYLLRQDQINFSIQGRGTHFVPHSAYSLIVSARAFSHMTWYDQGIIEVGAGCSLNQLSQFLFEKNQEVALEAAPLSSSKRSIAGLLLSGKMMEKRYHSESLSSSLLGIEFVTREGCQVKWGGPYLSALAGPSLHQLIWGLETFPGIIVKLVLKTYPIPLVRLQLAWKFHEQKQLEEHFDKLKECSTSWEYLEAVISGNPNDQGFIFAQISGIPEEMSVFSQLCPLYAFANQKGERQALRQYFSIQTDLKVDIVERNYSLKSNEYLWRQQGKQAWLLTSKLTDQEEKDFPVWKQRFCESLMR